MLRKFKQLLGLRRPLKRRHRVSGEKFWSKSTRVETANHLPQEEFAHTVNLLN